MSRVKNVIGNTKDNTVAELCAVSGQALQTGAIEYKLGNKCYIKVNPGKILTDKRLAELKRESAPRVNKAVKSKGESE